MKMEAEEVFGWGVLAAVIVALGYMLWDAGSHGGLGEPCNRQGGCVSEVLKCVPVGTGFQCVLK